MTQKHPEYNGPAMGPKMATENKRGFTEEDNRKMRDGSIGLQVNLKSISVIFNFEYIYVNILIQPFISLSILHNFFFSGRSEPRSNSSRSRWHGKYSAHVIKNK